MELTRKIIKVGNSSGVILPREWYGGVAKVELIEKPIEIKKDIIDILKDYLPSILGIYLSGSYAREEEKEDSDIDVLVISSDVDKRIISGKYDILIISLEELQKAIKIALPIIPMIKEAKVILNKELLEQLKSNKVNRTNLKWHLDTTKSSLKIIGTILDLTKKDKLQMIGGNVIYPLILRLRQIYIVDCLLENRIYKNGEFIKFLRNNNIHELYTEYKKEKIGKKARMMDKQIVEKAYKLANDYFKKQQEKVKKL